MQQLDGRLVYSATDLNNYLECEHLVALTRAVARRDRERPAASPTSELIREKGLEHEKAYLARLTADHPGLVAIAGGEPSEAGLREAEALTVAAMRAGAPYVYQATFFDGTFVGKADFLRRVETPSDFGAWSYEVIDTKLALHDKPYFIVQLCHYSEHLERVQGRRPERMHVVLGHNLERRFRVDDFFAYYRRLKAGFLAHGAASDAYPLPVSHCNVCDWSDECARTRRRDDHLSLVAWMRRDHVAALEAAGIPTLAALAAAATRPEGMHERTFARLRRQASLQLAERDEGVARYEFVDHLPPEGFGLLPPPDDGDLFFDMEGDQFYEVGKGLEYLFGFYAPREDRFTPFWGLDRIDERSGFEAAVDFIAARRERFPKMHVYHYAPYEKVAFRRLAQRHLTREEDVDDFLRAELFVDLYGVVRQSLVISKESYSIKKLEPYYGMVREAEVRRGDDSVVQFELWLKHPERRDILEQIRAYNEEDCRSTYLLREWLMRLRGEFVASRDEPRPLRAVDGDLCHFPPEAGCKKCEERERSRLENAKISAEQHALVALGDGPARLLGHLLSYHRREEKPGWWALFDRASRIDELVEFDHDAIGGLVLATDIACERKPKERNATYAYRFPEQQYSLRAGDRPYDPHTKKGAGAIVSIDENENVVCVKRAGDAAEAATLRALIPGAPVVADAQKEALARIGAAFLDGSLARVCLVVIDLLERALPRLRDRPRGARLQPDDANAQEIYAVIRALDRSYLFVQGPPGTGKTYRAARVIARLLHDGKRVGIMANSHKAVHNLLHELENVLASEHAGLDIRGVHKGSSTNPGSEFVSKLPRPYVESVTSNAPVETGDHELISGTGYLFAREAMAGRLDVLVIDEAGQTALAEAVAVAPAAENLVLLGDPMQLAQVSQGGHGENAGVSVLEHLLGEAATVDPNRGILLDVTYRMQPQIAAFISDTVYDGRLRADAKTAANAVASPGLTGSGLRYVPVEHAHRGRESPEEARHICAEIALLLGDGSRERAGTFVRDGKAAQLTQGDVLVVTPYNAQRIAVANALSAAGYAGVRVGTVDKFQGQEAPVVFYSMATSSAADVPRSLDFLFEKNRFNVAISRAQCLAILVCSPRLLDVRCTTVEQLAAVNVVCKFVESAQA